GILYYWSAATTSIMRGAFDAATASRLYPGTGTTCVGCHTISRAGTALATGYGGETLQAIELPSLAATISAADKRAMGWAAYSPDGSLLLIANKGTLALLDAATGAPLGSPDGRVALGPNAFATHPDWSPDGSAVAVALTTSAPNN